MDHRLPERTAWVNSLPEAYFPEMDRHFRALTKSWYDPDSDYGKYDLACRIYGRMSQSQEYVLPWLKHAIPNLSTLTAFEVGCGSGSSTVPLSRSAANVFALDISRADLAIGRERCALLGAHNVQFICEDPDWIDRYYQNWQSVVSDRVDVVYTYALLEHLLPVERIKLLKGVWQHLEVGGYLITVELPNRLNWIDWHGTALPFSDSLPSELSYLYNAQSTHGGMGPRIKAADLEHIGQCDREKLYRFGRGASYHEFMIAIGMENFEIVGGPYDAPPRIYRGNLFGYDPDWEAALQRKLEKIGVPKAFAAPCLDLVIRKTA